MKEFDDDLGKFYIDEYSTIRWHNVDPHDIQINYGNAFREREAGFYEEFIWRAHGCESLHNTDPGLLHLNSNPLSVSHRAFTQMHRKGSNLDKYIYRKLTDNKSTMNNVQFFRNVNDYTISAYEQYAKKVAPDPIDTKMMILRNVRTEDFEPIVSELKSKVIAAGYTLITSLSGHFDSGELRHDISGFRVYEQRFLHFTKIECHGGVEENVMVEVYGKDWYITISFLGDADLSHLFTPIRDGLRSVYKNTTEKKPIFYTISTTASGFALKAMEVKADYGELLLDSYNENFLPLHERVTHYMDENKKGLILLHGEYGTGKSCYIKHLISRKVKNRKIVYIPPHLAESIAAPNFISFVRDELQNSVMVIEDAESILQSRDETYGSNSAVSNLLNITDGILGDALNILIICTFNTSKARIDKGLLRKGRLVAEYHFDLLEQSRADALMQKLHQKNATGPMTLADIYNSDDEQIVTPEAPKRAIGFDVSHLQDHSTVVT